MHDISVGDLRLPFDETPARTHRDSRIIDNLTYIYICILSPAEKKYIVKEITNFSTAKATESKS